MAVQEGYLVGPRVNRSILFGRMSAGQLLTLGAGGILGLIVMTAFPWPIVGMFPVALAMGGLVMNAAAVAAFVPVRGLLVGEWTPQLLSTLLVTARGAASWRSSAIGFGVALTAAGDLEMIESLPSEFGDLRLVDLAGVGVVHDRGAGTICGAVRVSLRAMGLLGDDDQRRRYAAFGRILDTLALESDPCFRLQLLKRVVPRRQNELVSYLEDMVVDRSCRQARDLFELVDQTAGIARDHELYAIIRQGCRLRGTRTDQERQLQAAGVALRDRLERLDGMLRKADIALNAPDRILDVRQLARLVKDQVDPYGREARELLDHETGDDGLDPEMAWPDSRDLRLDCWRADSADHATFWVKGWPSVPVGEGWLAPLLLPAGVRVLNVSLIMMPVAAQQAMARARRDVMSDRSSRMTRERTRQVETTEHADAEDQSRRKENEIARGHSLWRWEANISTSVPAGDRRGLREAVSEVQRACAQARLAPVPMHGRHQVHFLRTLPFARGLRAR